MTDFLNEVIETPLPNGGVRTGTRRAIQREDQLIRDLMDSLVIATCCRDWLTVPGKQGKCGLCGERPVIDWNKESK